MPGMRNNRKPRSKVENPKQLFVRLMKLVLKNYLVPFLLVIACILIAAWATLQGTLFQKTLIDGYILPMLAAKSNDFAPLAAALGKLAVIYLIGVAASYPYQRIMITISQGRSAIFERSCSRTWSRCRSGILIRMRMAILCRSIRTISIRSGS